MVLLFVILGICLFLVLFVLWLAYRVRKNTFRHTYYDNHLLHYPSPEDYPYINKKDYPVQLKKIKLYGALFSSVNIVSYKGLLVFCHGLGPGQIPYMQEIAYFAEHGYLVYAFDVQGCGQSEGKYVRGYPTALLNLHNVLKFIEKDETLKDYPLYLFGHSMGGYAVNNITRYGHKIRAVISVSSCNTSYGGLYDQLVLSMKVEAKVFYPAFALLDFFTFGAKGLWSSVAAVKKTEVPYLFIQGDEDNTFTYQRNMEIYRKNLEGKENTEFITAEGRMHHALDSREACDYEKESFASFENLASEHEGHIPPVLEKKYYDELDYTRLYQLDEEIMTQILHFLSRY